MPDEEKGHSIAAVRKLLTARFDDVELDAFIQDYYLTVYDRFSRGMRKDEKINLLLDHCRRLEREMERLAATVHARAPRTYNSSPSLDPEVTPGRGRLPPGAGERTAQYDLRAVHDLLVMAYTTQELRRLFMYSENPELRPLRDELGDADGLEETVAKVIRYCETRAILADLLREVAKERPRVFERFAGRVQAGG